MTVQHFAFAKFKPSVSDADKKQVVEAAYALISPIPGVKNLKVGPPVSGALAQGYGFALTAEFDDFTAFKKYESHPEHIKFIRALRPATEGKALISYQIDTSAKARL